MKCYILDDQYAKVIYMGLKNILPNLIYPVKDNIKNPLEYLHLIESNDIVLLDNYFPIPEGRFGPLGANFLESVIANNLSIKIICISDYGKGLLDTYESWNTAYEKGIIIDFVLTKDTKDIAKVIKSLISNT